VTLNSKLRPFIRVFATALMVLPTVALGWAEGKTLLNFEGKKGGAPSGNLIFDDAGNLYGTTTAGGGSPNCTLGCGTVFRLEPTADGRWKQSVLYRFGGNIDGAAPYSGLIFDAAGSLYGTTPYGGGSKNCAIFGGSGCGTVFKLSPQADGTWKESILYRFAGGADGARPFSGVVLDASGNLYGATTYGGDEKCYARVGCGLVYKLSWGPSGLWTKTTLHVFAGAASNSDGALPFGTLVFDPQGNLYGTTTTGGTGSGLSAFGTVFELAPAAEGWNYEVIHRFNYTDGADPSAGLVIDAVGVLYGTASNGGAAEQGTVFELSPGTGGSWSESVLYSFQSFADGNSPTSSVALAGPDELYVTTTWGGVEANDCSAGCGTLHRLARSQSGWNAQLIHRFGENDGHAPNGVTLDVQGHVYGTAQKGGEFSDGVVFEFIP
jgi:uncharacterized repeat protein (TIGR03803 family)